jgi:beta-xylosidase
MPIANPIIRHKFTADPTAIVHKDTVYLYTGHDEPPSGIDDYHMHEWLCFSSKDLNSWQEHPSPLKATDFNWAKGDAYASKVIFHNNKFYWFVSVSHATIPGKAIGVATSDNPTGPFTDAIGSALITQDMIPDPQLPLVNLDPTVLIDDANQAHLIFHSLPSPKAPISTPTTPGITSPMLRLPRKSRLRHEPQPGRPLDIQRYPQRAPRQLPDKQTRRHRIQRKILVLLPQRRPAKRRQP